MGASFHREQGTDTLVICQSTEACNIVEPTGIVLMGHHYFEWLCTYIKVIYLFIALKMYVLPNKCGLLIVFCRSVVSIARVMLSSVVYFVGKSGDLCSIL